MALDGNYEYKFLGESRAWIYNWCDDRFFGCQIKPQPTQTPDSPTPHTNSNVQTDMYHEKATTKMINGRQARLDAFIGIVIGPSENLQRLHDTIPCPITIDELQCGNSLQSPLVYNPAKLLRPPHTLPRGNTALLFLRRCPSNGHQVGKKVNTINSNYSKLQQLAHLRRYILHNEIRLGVHLCAFETLELNASLLYSVRFPDAETKLPYGWVTLRCYLELPTEQRVYDIVEDVGCECEQDNSTCCQLVPSLSCVSLDIEVAVSSKVGLFPHYSVNPILCIACIEGHLDPNNDSFNVARRVVYTTLKCKCSSEFSTTCTQFGNCLLSPLSSAKCVTVKRFSCEREMLANCIKLSLTPFTIITGYNVSRFDLPYIFKRLLVLRAKSFDLKGNPQFPKELTDDQCNLLDSSFGNTFFRHQMPMARWQKAVKWIRLPNQIILDVYSYVHQFSEAAFKNLVTKKLDDVCHFENIAGGKYGQLSENSTTTQLSTLEIVRSLNPHLILPYCERDTALPLVLLTEKKYFRFILSLSQLTGNSMETVLETNISSIIANFHSLYSIVAAKTITPYRFVYNGTSAVGSDYTYHVSEILPKRKFFAASWSTERASQDDEDDDAEPYNSPCNHRDKNDDDTVLGAKSLTIAAHGHESSSALPLKVKREKMKGGMVIEPTPGIYEGAIDSVDVESLYPSVEIALNMSPGTMFRLKMTEVEELGGSDRFSDRFNNFPSSDVGYCILSLKGPKGPFVVVQRHLLQLRRQLRAQMKLAEHAQDSEQARLDALQKVLKLLANAGYGTVASTMHLPTTNRSIGETTTHISREVLSKVYSVFTNDYGIPVIYGDTDSIMLHASKVSEAQFVARCAHLDGVNIDAGTRAHHSHEPPSGEMLAARATAIVGKNFPSTIDPDLNLPVVRFALERRYALYAVCRKKMNVSLLNPGRELRVTGLKSHAPDVVKSSVLKVLKSILEYRVDIAKSEALQSSHSALTFKEPTQLDLAWVAKQYLIEYKSHFVHNFENSRSVNKVKSSVSRPADYLRRMSLVTGSPISTDMVEHVKIWSDFSVDKLEKILNVRTRDEFKSCYVIDINPLFFSSDRGSLLRDTLVMSPPLSSVAHLGATSNNDCDIGNVEVMSRASDCADGVATIASRLWLQDVILPSLNSLFVPGDDIDMHKVVVFDLTDTTAVVGCQKLLRIQFVDSPRHPPALIKFVTKLQAWARACLPQSEIIDVTDWGPDPVVSEVFDSGTTVFEQMMSQSRARGKKRQKTKSACPLKDLRQYVNPQLQIQHCTDTLQRPRRYQGWTLGEHELHLTLFLSFLSILYWHPRQAVSLRDRQARPTQSRQPGVSRKPFDTQATFLSKLNSQLKSILDATHNNNSNLNQYVIVRSSCGCALFWGSNLVKMAASFHDLIADDDNHLALQSIEHDVIF